VNPIQKKAFTICLFIGIFILSIFILRFNVPVSKFSIVGTYINNNEGEDVIYPETPYIADTLVLKQDRTFTSKFYGSGTYSLSQGILSKRLSIRYGYKFKTVKSLPIKNRTFSPIKLILVSDLNQYYKKISN